MKQKAEKYGKFRNHQIDSMNIEDNLNDNSIVRIVNSDILTQLSKE